MGGWRAHLLSIPPFILPVGSNHYQWYMVIGPSYLEINLLIFTKEKES